MSDKIRVHQLPNGMVLLAEPMEWLESAAFTLAVPAGCSRDGERQLGISNFACEMVQRGCGSRDSREFVEELDSLGVERSASVSTIHTSFGAAMPAEQLPQALAIYADLVRRPHLPADQLEDGRLVCLQEIHSLEDDLAQQAMLALRARHYPQPFGRHALGSEDTIHSISIDDIRDHVERMYCPTEAILSVAGRIEWPQLCADVETWFGDWEPRSLSDIELIAGPGKYQHLQHDSNQTHIGVAYDSVAYGDPDYYQARGAVGILSDGMSSRLFTEVREVRGLCYSVYAACHSLRQRGSVQCYAGTTTERAQETLDVLLSELSRLAAGVEQDELDRLKARIKSALIMQQESSAARSGSMAADWYFLHRVQSLDDVGKIIDGLTCDSINEYLAAHPPGDFTIVTLGERALEVPIAV